MESGTPIKKTNDTTINPTALLIHIFIFLPNDLFFNETKHKKTLRWLGEYHILGYKNYGKY
jgi:hypothetical protein